MGNPMVSVFMVTYNHERFIREAIESVLEQETDFNYELVICEDCSTDGTARIIQEYAEKYPHKIKANINKVNVGAQKNFTNITKLCSGKYVAILDGDDFWTHSLKLQRQVDFLEKNSDCTICWHPRTVFSETGEFEPYETHSTERYRKEKLTVNSLIFSNFIPTSSIMFRNHVVVEIPKWFENLPMSDAPLNLLLAHHGNIGYIGYNMAAYREHSGGIWSSTKKERQIYNTEKYIEVYLKFNQETKYKYDHLIQQSIFSRMTSLINFYRYYLGENSSKELSLLKIMNKLKSNVSIHSRFAKKSIAVFGTGEASKRVLNMLRSLDVEVEYFLDNNSKKWGESFEGASVISPDEINSRSLDDSLIIIASMYYKDISEQLVEMGLEIDKHFINGFDYEKLMETGKETLVSMELEIPILKLVQN
ncbi:glycosyltransferase [Cohnella thailandensis]|uniref:Glycosyltransferase n=1 Tax=Cohnella thailandensis TaxID=557557 RepID=A0A841SN19_9BACL|nr:glycosyltransferase [Cohnella thailandensis]MBB6632572.1 glycosyltransferase [Cohnella thailandensis]MBP1971866.1 glycosyltransferase involved in cell wall biosynthesis [Cohnella thailandensis]